MGKNISISEGQRGRNFGPVQKLNIPLSGGGMSLWVPEEEANDYASKEDARFTENREYTPQNALAFRNVDVHVEPSLGTREFTENGEFSAEDEGLDGWSEVSVNIANPSGVVIAKPSPITESGDYDPADDGADGYSQVVVQVEEISTEDDEGNQWTGSIDENGVASVTMETPDGDVYELVTDCENGITVSDGTYDATFYDNGSMDVTVIDPEDGKTYIVHVNADGTWSKTLKT